MTRCNRCEYRADDLADHARETQHWLCVVCRRRSLTEHERQTCAKCISAVRDDLDAVARTYVELVQILHQNPVVPIDTLTILGDGATQGGGPDDDLRYHDPCSAAAELEAAERDWREEFGHGPVTYPPLGAPRRPAHVFAEAYRYLATWHALAARTHPGFDDFAQQIRALRFRLELVAGKADLPRRDPVPCGCGGKLVQDYRDDGLSDDRRCRDCGTVYSANDYAFHLRLLTDTPGWVSVQQAAALVGRPVVTVKAWISGLDLPAVCNRLTRRMLVDEHRVRELAEERQTRRRSA